MTKNMFIWYDSRGFWMIGNNQHFARQNGEGNLRLYTRGTLKNTDFRVVDSFLGLDIGELNSRGWEESDDKGQWAKRATVFITPHKNKDNDENSDDDFQNNLDIINNRLDRANRGLQYY